MPYIVIFTFDLKGAKPECYKPFHSGLSALGLKKQLISSTGKKLEVSNTFIGKFPISKYPDERQCRNDLTQKIDALLVSQRLRARRFLLVARSKWTWKWKGK